MKKIISLILLASVTVGAAAACGGAGTGEPASTTAAPDGGAVTEPAETEPLSDLELRALVSDDLPEADYGGYTWRIVAETNYLNHYFMEEEDGDVIDDAVYGRNLRVSERYNIDYEVVCDTDQGNFIKKTVTAGEDAFDVVSMHVVSLSGSAVNGYFMNFYDLPYVNFEKPWWGQSNIDDLTYHGVALMGVGNYGLNSIGQTYCVFFDKTKVENYGLGDLYAIVNDGVWTIDKQTELTKDIYLDQNGDGQRDIEDLYGFATSPYSNINAYLWAFDNPICAKDEKGDISVVIHTPKASSIVDKLAFITHDVPGTFYSTKYQSKDGMGKHGGPRDLFVKGNVLLANGLFEYSLLYFRECADFGIIPYPKWDENQERYLTMVDGGHAAEAVPLTCQDPERTSVILEALNAETYKTVVPAYYEIALKVKYARDNESIEMMDMIMQSRIFDFGYVYDNWNGASFWMENLVANKNHD
ncbi:MAG: hypothetical protein K6D94_12840, partial [Clostridiales bacterium]|nr:hypothetical protein [Clostridiales bacterium]